MGIRPDRENWGLVVEVEAEERDGCQSNGAEQDFGDVVVENLVVGVGRRRLILSPLREVPSRSLIGAWGSIVVDTCLLAGMACNSLGLRRTNFPCAAVVHFIGEFPCCSGARVFITKVRRLHNRYFQEIWGFFPKKDWGWVGRTRRVRRWAESAEKSWCVVTWKLLERL